MITGNDSIQEPDNPSKKAKMDSISDEKKHNLKKTPPPCKNKQDCVDGSNDKTHESDNSTSDTDSCARNLYDEQKMKTMKRH